MGTSNWQNIPFCIDALMKIAPQRVVDIGVGFGRWGIIVREFCDVWYGRVLHDSWQVHIEGIEGFQDNIANYHSDFYDKIHIGDARQLLPTLLQDNWDVIIFGDVLEHFTKTEATALLEQSLAASHYVMVNIPLEDEWPQEELYDNPYERHLSVWSAAEFGQFYVRRQRLFMDFMDRPFGSFILSKADPKDLTTSLFSKNSQFAAQQACDQEFNEWRRQVMTQLAQQAEELERIKSSLTWQTYTAIDQSPLGQPLRNFMKVVGSPVRRYLRRKKETALPRPDTPPREGLPAANHPVTPPASQPDIPAPISQLPPAYLPEEIAWLNRTVAAQPSAIAVLHPDWRGILSSTRNLLPTCYFVNDTVNEARAAHLAHLLAESGCPRVVFSGFPLSHQHLLMALHRLRPTIKCYVLWHGNFLQTCEDYAWQGFQVVHDLCRQGLIYKWGFVKQGMAEIMAHTGIKTGFVMNYVNDIPVRASTPLADGPHLGLWGVAYNWRKLPYAMLAAIPMIPGAKVHTSAASERMQQFSRLLGIDLASPHQELIPQQEMLTWLSQMHLNLYVTLSECAPMLPLESLSVGVPCLIGPNSHLFSDHDYLHRMLVVPYPDSAQAIADYAQRALAQRDEIVAAYIDYAPGYNARARDSLAKFLEL